MVGAASRHATVLGNARLSSRRLVKAASVQIDKGATGTSAKTKGVVKGNRSCYGTLSIVIGEIVMHRSPRRRLPEIVSTTDWLKA